MIHLLLRLTLTFSVSVVILGGSARAETTPTPPSSLPPIEHFFNNPSFSNAVLSPDARFLAMRIGVKGKPDSLGVYDIEKSSAKIVAMFDDLDVAYFQWISPNRLVFNTTETKRAQGEVRFWPGLYAVNRDGSEFRKLVSHGYFDQDRADSKIKRNPANLLPPNYFLMHQKGAQDSEYVYVTTPYTAEGRPSETVDLLRLNTLTRAIESVKRPVGARQWLLDQQGIPRIVTTEKDDKTTIYYRDSAQAEWRKMTEFKTFELSKDVFSPFDFGPDGQLFVETYAGRDKLALHVFDTKTEKVADDPIVALDGFDFKGELIVQNNKLMGIGFEVDATGVQWFDGGMKAAQKEVDALLPGTINTLHVAARPELPVVLVHASSDVLPSTYLLYNTATKKLTNVGSTFPNIKPQQMGQQRFVRLKARDGLDIPTWLTLPPGNVQKDLPMVVLVHGGPYVRGTSWGWNPQTQFLASRGYAVLEPEFRGSTGYGFKHFQAGWKQWGLKMQDDIADATRWAIAQGFANPKRICIAGASYGGYAALMGLINDPDLYRCGINWVGVTDINLIYDGHWSHESDMTEQWKQYGMPVLVGDQVKDAAQLKATSPLEHAARITQPLLLAYGTADDRVPIYHGTKFYEAVKAHNKNVEWIAYADEGHGWRLPENRVDFWSKVERFLSKNIGKP